QDEHNRNPAANTPLADFLDIDQDVLNSEGISGTANEQGDGYVNALHLVFEDFDMGGQLDNPVTGDLIFAHAQLGAGNDKGGPLYVNGEPVGGNGNGNGNGNDNGGGNTTVVPAPSGAATAVLMLLGLIGIGATKRRYNNQGTTGHMV